MKKKLILAVLLCSCANLYSHNIEVERGGSDASFLKKIVTNSNFTVKYTNGDFENIKDVLKNQAGVSIVQEDILRDVASSKPSVAKRLVIISPFKEDYIFLIVHKSSNIHSFKDLQGHTVALSKKGSGAYYTFLSLQEKYNINAEIYSIGQKEAVKAFKNKQADSYFYIGDMSSISYMDDFYRLIPISIESLSLKKVKIGKHEYVTSRIGKFLLSSKNNIDTINKSDLQILLSNLISYGDRDYLCSFKNSSLPIEAKSYIYFSCANNIKSKKGESPIINSKELIFDDIEDITIYPIALENKRYVGHNTSYMVEKTKLNNSIRLFKKELEENPSSKLFIVCYAESGDTEKFIDKIYRYFKKSKISRSSIIKKSIPIKNCKNNCFYETKIEFRLAN